MNKLAENYIKDLSGLVFVLIWIIFSTKRIVL